VAAALFGALALFGLKQSQMMSISSRNADVDRQIIDFQDGVTKQIQQTDICKANFDLKNINFDFQNLYAADGTTVIYSEGNKYFNDKIELTKISTEKINGQAYLVLGLTKLEAKANTKLISKKIMLLAELDATDNVINCFGIQDSSSNTVQYLVAKNICEKTYGVATPAFTSHFDGVAKTCTLDGIQSTANIACPQGQSITSYIYNNIDHTITPQCGSTFISNTCTGGWMKSIDGSGNTTCLSFADLVDSTAYTFIPESQCKLTITGANKIKLACTPPPMGNCADLPIAGECGPAVIGGVDYTHCNTPILCSCLISPPTICVANAPACSALGGCL